MIKNVKQYISDVCFQLSHSDVDDVIWIYLPIVAVCAAVLALIIKTFQLVIL